MFFAVTVKDLHLGASTKEYTAVASLDCFVFESEDKIFVQLFCGDIIGPFFVCHSSILDWELSTLGHPLADAGFNAMAWHTRPDEYGGLAGLDLAALGIPPLDEYVAHYLRAAGRKDGIAPFHVAFALFRFAVIFEGIAARAAAGNAASDDASEAGKLGPAFARRAVELVGA